MEYDHLHNPYQHDAAVRAYHRTLTPEQRMEIFFAKMAEFRALFPNECQGMARVGRILTREEMRREAALEDAEMQEVLARMNPRHPSHSASPPAAPAD